MLGGEEVGRVPKFKKMELSGQMVMEHSDDVSIATHNI